MSGPTKIKCLLGLCVCIRVFYRIYPSIKRKIFPYKRPPINNSLVELYNVLQQNKQGSVYNEYETSLVGIQYENRKVILKSLDENEKVILCPDTENKYLKSAIKCVTLRGEVLGYLSHEAGGMNSLGEKLASQEVALPVTQFRFTGRKAMLKFCVI